jgi:flagellar protein FliL
MADKGADEEPKKKKGGIVKILIFVLGGLMLVGVGVGGGYVLFGMSAPTPSEEIDMIIERKLQESGQLPMPEDAAGEDAAPARQTKPVEAAPTFVTSYYEFPSEFTTNLNGSRKFLQIGVGVSTQYDATVVANVETHQLALRSEILGTISEFTEEDIAGKDGRDRLAAALRDAINARLTILENFGGVEDVYFTTFMLQ